MVEIFRILFYGEDKKKGDRLCGGQMPRCNNKKMPKDFYFLKNESATHSSAVKSVFEIGPSAFLRYRAIKNFLFLMKKEYFSVESHEVVAYLN